MYGILWSGLRLGLTRPYIRKSTRHAIESTAKIQNGRFVDANTGKPIPGTKRRSFSIAAAKYDLGHKPGHEHRYEVAEAKAEGLSQNQKN